MGCTQGCCTWTCLLCRTVRWQQRCCRPVAAALELRYPPLRGGGCTARPQPLQRAGPSAFRTDLGSGGTQVPLALFAGPGALPLPSTPSRDSVRSGGGHPAVPGWHLTFALPVAVSGVAQVPGIFPVELRHQGLERVPYQQDRRVEHFNLCLAAFMCFHTDGPSTSPVVFFSFKTCLTRQDCWLFHLIICLCLFTL